MVALLISMGQDNGIPIVITDSAVVALLISMGQDISRRIGERENAVVALLISMGQDTIADDCGSPMPWLPS